jgi:hypothetical protein
MGWALRVGVLTDETVGLFWKLKPEFGGSGTEERVFYGLMDEVDAPIANG